MLDVQAIKLPNGDFYPIPTGGTVTYTDKAKITTVPNVCIVKEFFNGQKVQMLSYSLGLETQTEWTKAGVHRKSWDENGNLRFRVVSRLNGHVNVAHEICYRDQKVHHIGLTFLNPTTELSLHLIKKKDKVSTLIFSNNGDAMEEPIDDFPTGKRFLGIRSIADLEKLKDSRQRE